MVSYKLTDSALILCGDGRSIPSDPLNTDYVKYLEWIAEGNTPEPDDPLPVIPEDISPVEKLQAFLAANPDVAALL